MQTLLKGEFHGRGRDRRSDGGLTLADTEYEAGHTLPQHAHARPFFCLVLQGSFDERLPWGRRSCVPASFVWYPAEEPHALTFGEDGGRALNVEFDDAWLDTLRAHRLDGPDRSVSTQGARVNWVATRLYRDFVNARGGLDLTAQEHVLEIVADLADCAERGRETGLPPWLARARDSLHARWDQVVRVSDLAEEADVHPVHLARVFRRRFGCTLGEYQRRLRVEAACAALSDADVSLSALALRTGFADQAHFTRRFKEVTGMTPGAYRALLGN